MKTQIATIFAIGWLGQAMATDFTFALECKTAGGEGCEIRVPGVYQYRPGRDQILPGGRPYRDLVRHTARVASI